MASGIRVSKCMGKLIARIYSIIHSQFALIRYSVYILFIMTG